MPGGVDGGDCSKGAGLDQARGGLMSPLAAPLGSDLDSHFRGLDRIISQDGILERVGHGLLAEGMLAGPRGCRKDWAMRVIGSGDDHRIHIAA